MEPDFLPNQSTSPDDTEKCTPAPAGEVLVGEEAVRDEALGSEPVGDEPPKVDTRPTEKPAVRVVNSDVELNADSEQAASRSSFVENDFERVYAQWRENGDPELRERLILMHRSLVMYLARRFSDRGEGMDDVIQQGMIGLIYALDHFDPDRGVRFATFATPTIIGEIRRYFRDKSRGVRVPRRVQELNQTILTKIELLTQEFNRSPTYREIAQSLDLRVEEVIETMESGRALDPISLDEPYAGEDLVPLAERIGDVDPALVLSDEQSLLRAALLRLPEKHRQVLHYAYFENKSQVEIAGKLKVSQMHVSRLLRAALAQLRKYLEDERI